MGLHTWTDAQHGKIQKFDVVVAKNYLNESEFAQLSRLVNAYLDVAESMALRKIPTTMQDWETRLNRFLDATDHAVLSDIGKVTAEIAKARRERVREVPHRARPALRERLRSGRGRDEAAQRGHGEGHATEGKEVMTRPSQTDDAVTPKVNTAKQAEFTSPASAESLPPRSRARDAASPPTNTRS
jgi:hypothetical protein